MKRLLRALLPLLVLAGGVATANLFITTRPKAAPVEMEDPSTTVEVLEIRRGAHRARVWAMGLVEPERQVVIQPEVGGRIVEQNTDLVVGGRIAEGHPLVRVDSRDYAAALEIWKADLAQAELQVREEQTRKQVAEHEWRRRPSGFTDDTLAFAIREPHLGVARARVRSAQSRLDQARRDVSRTIVRAPFDALVLEEGVELGQSVGPQSRIATLVAIDRYWIRVSLPVAQLPYLDIPEVNLDAPRGSSVRVVNEAVGDHDMRPGYVVGLQGAVDARGRMAQLFVAVDDPLGLQQPAEHRPPPLLLGTHVRVEIEGRELRDVAEIPRSALRADETSVWCLDGDDLLRVRRVEIVRRERGSVLVSRGLETGDRLVITPLAIATEGMKVTPAGTPRR